MTLVIADMIDKQKYNRWTNRQRIIEFYNTLAFISNGFINHKEMHLLPSWGAKTYKKAQGIKTKVRNICTKQLSSQIAISLYNWDLLFLTSLSDALWRTPQLCIPSLSIHICRISWLQTSRHLSILRKSSTNNFLHHQIH